MLKKDFEYRDLALRVAATDPESVECKSGPSDKIACVECPEAIWMFVDKTDAAKTNSRQKMDPLTEKPSWRCYCLVLRNWSYDDFAGQPGPECWVYRCGAKEAALLKEADVET